MRLNRSQFYFLLALLTVAVGVATNVATSQMPTWIKPYLWLSWPILGLLAALFVILSVYQARHETSPSHPGSEAETRHSPGKLPPGAELPGGKRKSNRKALRRYLKQLIEEHKYFSFLGRAKPLDLEKIYIALKVGEYIPRQLSPDEPVQTNFDETPKQRSGTVEVPEALRLHNRLVVLGEPGSGKTTLLKYLALRICERDPSLAEFAREKIPRWLPGLADRVHKSFLKFGDNIIRWGLICGVIGMIIWIVGLFHSPQPVYAGIIGLALVLMIIFIFARMGIKIPTVISVVLLIYSLYSGLVTLKTAGVLILALILLLYPYWIRPPLKVADWIRYHFTRYPLPLYLTLNDLAKSDEPLESYLASMLGDIKFANPRQFLQQKLDGGECLVLLDALDEVVNETAYRRIAGEINRFSAYYPYNQIVVTCRVAGFRGLLQGFLQLEVQELNEKQVAVFIRSWFADHAPEEQEARVDGLARCLERSARIRLLAANPLLLSIITLLYERNFTLPERRVELYDECAQVLLVKRDIEKGLDTEARFPPVKKRQALQSLAAHLHQKGRRIFSEQELLTALAELLPVLGYSGSRNSELLQEVIERSGLLRQKSRTSFDFAHLTFQEFFTAADFLQKGEAKQLLKHLNDPWWREVILLFVGLEPDATPLLERLKKHDILLAGWALADARSVPADKFERIAGAIISELKQIMENDPQRRQEAADILAEIARWGATEYLVDKVRAEGQAPVALAAVLGLSRAAEKPVLERLFDPLGPILHMLNSSLGAINLRINERILSLLEAIGFPMVFVPSGEFLMGSDEFSNSRPPHQVDLSDFWIDRYPVTNAQFQKFIGETNHQLQATGPSTPGKENHPVVNISWHDAVAFCEWAGKKLPTEAQWEKAARGSDGRRYPWGNQLDHSRVNLNSRGTTPVDQYPNGVSPFGCYDMAGNVQEWCADWFESDYYRKSPHDNPTGPESGKQRVCRGGSWNYIENGIRTVGRNYGNPYDRYSSIGFRCVR